MSTTSFMLTATKGRYDLYGPIHKGLRRAHGMMLVRLGATDYTGDVGDMLDRLRAHLALCETHLADEEAFVHTALRARAPAAVAVLEQEHGDHRASFAALETAIRAVECVAPGAEAIACGRQLYLEFSRFVAEDLEHMAGEERDTWPVLCAHFTDAELHGIEMAIVGNLDPTTNLTFLGHVMPAANHPERVAMLRGMKAGMPPHVYAATLEQAVLPGLATGERDRLATMGLLA